jgi:uncharacterized protein (TIGR02569 family)
VVEAFGADHEPVPLVGGEGVTFRAGEIVIKRVHDVAEAEWVQTLLAGIDPDGFRVPAPVPTAVGDWVHEGWSASRFIADLRPAAPRWEEIARWGLRFGDAAQRSRPADSEALLQRTHRWAVADRVAWGETRADLAPEAEAVLEALHPLLIPGRASESHVVHGDLSGNVFLDASGGPVILDVSPYLRERRWAAAIVVADAVLWHGADVSIARQLAHVPEDRDLLARALTFRLVAEQLAAAPAHGGLLDPYRRVVRALS